MAPDENDLGSGETLFLDLTGPLTSKGVVGAPAGSSRLGEANDAGPAPSWPPRWWSGDEGTSLKHYEIVRPLGRGGMGVVYLARDTKLGRLVAIKVLREHNEGAAARFLSEARATARCRHENIVVIHDVDELDGRPYHGVRIP